MGTKVSLCEAITTPDVYVQLDSAQKEVQKFLRKFAQIQNVLTPKTKQKLQFITKLYSARHFVQGIYIGRFNSNALPHTQSQSDEGVFLYEAGFLYIGQFKNGKRQGQGILINENQQLYSGTWARNNPNGKGQYCSIQSSRSYVGDWLEGLQSGIGVEKYEDNSWYKGEFLQGLKNGEGILQYPDGTVYKGQFKQNKINGYGISQGKFHRYEGQWLNGKMHGSGFSTWTDQNKKLIGSYIGQYKQGLKHGYGEYRWGDKKVYKGKWEDGDMSGEGVLLNYEA